MAIDEVIAGWFSLRPLLFGSVDQTLMTGIQKYLAVLICIENIDKFNTVRQGNIYLYNMNIKSHKFDNGYSKFYHVKYGCQ